MLLPIFVSCNSSKTLSRNYVKEVNFTQTDTSVNYSIKRYKSHVILVDSLELTNNHNHKFEVKRNGKLSNKWWNSIIDNIRFIFKTNE